MIRLLRSHRLFPLLLVGLTGLLTVWLDQVSRWDSNRRELDPDKPEYVAEHLTATRFDAQGKLNERLIATRMWQYPGKDDAFFENPDQWELWKSERPATMVDEVVRWASPINVFQRTALNDTEVGGVPVAKGQRVGLFYASANFDAEVFADPFRFDIRRDPNPHVGFGGNGAHFCVGANLARQEVRLMFEALADLAPDITKLAEPRRLRSGWINGIKDLQVAYA